MRCPPSEALLALYRRRGPLVNTGIGRDGYTYLLGRAANKFVFANASAFSWRRTFENLALVDGPTALVVSDGDDHRRRRSVVAPGLRHRQVQDYVQTMVSTIDTAIDGWWPGAGQLPWLATGDGRPETHRQPHRRSDLRRPSGAQT